MAKRKGAVARHTKINDQKFLGKEPVYNGNELTKVDLNICYNWYNYFHDHNDSKSFTITFLKTNKANEPVYKALGLVNAQYFGVLGWICRMQSKGAKLPQSTIDYRNKKIKELVNRSKSVQPEVETEVSEENKNIIAIRISEKAQDIIGDIEVEIDKFTNNNYSSNFRLFDYLSKNQIKAPIVKKIIEYYKPWVTELTKLKARKDEQLEEAYKFLKKPYVDKYLTFLTSIVADANQFMIGAKAARKPRKKKVKSAEQLVAKLNYQQMDKTYKINSIDPRQIVGATQLWVFNTKARKLGVYSTEGGGQLNIKGSTIIGFDPKLSSQKKVRKPESVLNTITQGGKVALRNVMDNIKAKPSTLTGRINKDTILLKATK